MNPITFRPTGDSSQLIPSRRMSLLLAGPLALLLAVMFPDASPAQGQKPAQKSNRSSAASQSGLLFKLHPLEAQNEEGEEKRGEGPEFIRRRAEWFFKQRAFPLGFIPHGARVKALEERNRMLEREVSLGLRAAPGPGFVPPPSGPTSAWTSIGPAPTISLFFPPATSGRVTALAVNPNNANNVYLGAADGGLWISTDGGSNWASLTDQPPSAAIPSVAVGALVVDPATCQAAPNGICTTVYVGTGEDNFAADNIYGEGVLKCTVTGGTPPTAACTQDNTFRAPSPLDQTRGGPLIGSIAVNRRAGNNNILLAGVRGRGSALQSGVWCSQDGGVNWTHVLPNIAATATGDPGTDVGFASDGTAFAALGFPVGDANNGIYKSQAPVTGCSGINWVKQTLPSSIPSSSIGRIALAIAPLSDATIYAALADSTTGSSNLLGVIKSTNANTATPTWTELTASLVNSANGFCNNQCFYDLAIAVSPANPSVVFAGGAAKNAVVIRSLDGGNTWADVSSSSGQPSQPQNPHADTHALAFSNDGSILYTGNDGGVWKTSTPTASSITWNNLNTNLSITQFYPGHSIHTSTPFRGLGGTQDNGVQIYSRLPVQTWSDAQIPCDGGYTAIDTRTPSTIYGTCEYIPGGLLVIAVSFSNGPLGIISGNQLLVLNAVSGIDGTDRGSFISPLILDSRNPQTLYFGTCRVWQTKNGGNSWQAISPDVTDPAHNSGCSTTDLNHPGTLHTIVVAPSDSNTIYTGSDIRDVEVTLNGGQTWTSIATSLLPTRAVTQVAADPTVSKIAYVTFSGFGTCNNSAVTCDGKGHVFRTLDATLGSSTVWTDISKGPFSTTPLPDIPVNAIVIDPDDPLHNTLLPARTSACSSRAMAE